MATIELTKSPQPSVGRVVHAYFNGCGPYAALITCTNHEGEGNDVCCLDVSVPPCDAVPPEGAHSEVPRVELAEASRVENGRFVGPAKCWCWPARV